VLFFSWYGVIYVADRPTAWDMDWISRCPVPEWYFYAPTGVNLKTHRTRPGSTVSNCFQSALAYHWVGRLDEALRLYEAALARRPRHPEALHYLGLLHYQLGHLDQAIVSIKRSLIASPDRAQAMSDLGEVQRSAGHLPEAEMSCRRAIELRPDYVEAHVNLAVVLFQAGRFADAETEAKAALCLRPMFQPAMQVLADSLREQRQFQRAEVVYRQILDIQPNHAGALTNLGWMLVQNGFLEEGLRFCRQAAQQPANDILALQNLARALVEFGHFDEAMKILEQALHRSPNVPGLSLLIGIVWSELGELMEARNWLERSLQLDDKLLEARVRIAGLEAECDNHQVALDMLDDILASDPIRVDAIAARAKSKLALGDTDGAIEAHRAAIALSPQTASLHAALGTALASAGDIDGAIACHRQAIALNDRCLPAYAGLLTTLRHRVSDSERGAAVSLLNMPWMTDQRRAALHFGLAAYYDGAGNWSEAAARMVIANSLRKSVDERRKRAYDYGQYEANVDRIVSAFTPELFVKMSGMGSDSERPVFVFGMPRSGTTLAEQILASHHRVFGAGERPFANQDMQLLPHIARRPGNDPLACIEDLTGPQLAEIADWHLGQLALLDEGKCLRVVDKMPDNYHLIGWLAMLFPRARFVYCRRDPRDIALSCWITNFASIRWASDLGHIAHRITQHYRLMRHWAQVLPVSFLTVDYEAMVDDQERQSRRLIEWIGLDWDDRCLKFYETERLVRTASVAQVRQPIYRRSVARWRHYEEMLSPLLAKLDADLNLRSNQPSEKIF
jgi:tetratricopeptide (TPR) repeat protein